MKSFDTKDLKVSNRKFESSRRKHLDLEESANDFPEVSIVVLALFIIRGAFEKSFA